MKTQTIEVEGLRGCWKAVSYGWPKKNSDHVFDGIAVKLFVGKEDHAMLIVKQIQPRRIVLEETDKDNTMYASGYYGTQVFSNGLRLHNNQKIWREVKKTDIALTNDEPRLSLSICECKGLFEGNQPTINKVKEFIEENS